MEIDYLTSGSRSFFMTVNGGPSTELDLNGSSFSLPTSTVIPIQLQAGSNTIQFGNDTGYAPALDRIAIAPAVESSHLTTSVISKEGPRSLRIWKVSLNNLGVGRAIDSLINQLSLTQYDGSGSCHPKLIKGLPIEVGGILPGSNTSVDIPIDFSKCSDGARFSMTIVVSANNGSDVGANMLSSETR
jgi:alpha-galactosidase